MRHRPESVKALSGIQLASYGNVNVDNEEEKKQEEVKGFAGLSSMVSDVDAIIDSTPIKTQKAHSDTAPQPSAGNRPPVKQSQPRPTSKTYQSPAQPSSGSSAGKWLVGIAVVIGLIWLANQSDSNKSSRPAYSPGTSSTTVAPPSQPAVVQPEAPSRPSESKPSVGRNNVFSTAQIRYCLAEKIRLDASESVLNNYSDSDVNRINGYVDDYNSRCGEFRYRQGALESARRDVEPYRGQLQADGRSRFVRSPSAAIRAPSSTQAQKPARPTPDATVQAIQRRLNELGYNAGHADGLFGGKTRAAIQAFQRDYGISQDGVASSSLLTQLNARVANPRPLQRGEADSSSVSSAPPVARRSEPSSDRENYNSCISGEYPSLCKHSLLTSEEVVQVDAAEKRANFKTCISGEYPSLCKHSWLTKEQAGLVSGAEKRANYRTCITGEYPSLCMHSLLTDDEATRVNAAERQVNYRTCISGDYPSLCKHFLLTQDEAMRVAEAERRAKGR